MERCEECGYAYDLTAATRAGDEIRSAVAELARLLVTTERRALARRTAPERWSPLEYACHVRDVLITQRERVLLARRTDVPAAVPMGRDERAAHDGYAESDPAEVAEEVTIAARLLANTLSRLGTRDWELRIVYNWPHRTERTLRWVAANTVHDVRHHLLDIKRQVLA
ncbi:DinB family protein [Mycobacterium paraense]|uniref:DinB family protein n=1 Tax=Mycobacterium paraense TaxID=767916 RepID=UPI000A146523|nr:DinB family protein [Mycobacterium paraense]